MGFRPGQARGPFVGTTGGGGTSFSDGQGVSTENEVLNSSVAAFRDDFNTTKPFWQGTDVLTSDNWEIDTANEWMIGLTGTEGEDYFRYGVEGDFDYSAKVTCEDTGDYASHGIYTSGNSIVARVYVTTSEVKFKVTGKSDATESLLGTPQWIRLVRSGNNHIAAYHRLNDTDSWTLIGEYTDIDLSDNVKIGFSHSEDSKFHEVIFYDNMISEQIKSGIPKIIYELTDSATISIDAKISNQYKVTLEGNRTLANPTNPTPGQLISIRVTQDGTGSRELDFDTDYRFSTSLPEPTLTTTPDATDYLGFIYNADDEKWDYICEVKGF